MALVLFLFSTSKEYFELPLIICTVFFLIFFACEGIWFQIAAARKEKNWAESDRLRDEIAKLGYTIKDAPGNVWQIQKI